MAKLKGEALRAWCKQWEETDHGGKLRLCERSGITYESGRHWYSDAPNEYKTAVERPMQMTVEQIVGSRPAINLDFVSFDLETSNLTADFSIVLSAVIKPFGQDPIVFRADSYDGWLTNRANDKDIVVDISSELRKHAIVITHYGMYFDVPYIRAKMSHHSLEPLPPMFAIDSWAIAHKNFKVSSRRLKNLARYFDIGEKSEVEGGLWLEAAYSGSREAMDKIVKHNVVDCEVLEKLACISFPYLKSIPRM